MKIPHCTVVVWLGIFVLTFKLSRGRSLCFKGKTQGGGTTNEIYKEGMVMENNGTKLASVFAVADYFIANACPGEGITYLKLQKLCAYAQAYCLALHNGRRLFDAPLVARANGPVAKELDERYSSDNKSQLSTDIKPGEESRSVFDHEQLFILETVNDYYGRFAARPLRDMSHIDFPGDFDGPESIIPDEEIVAKFARHEVIKTIQADFR